MPHPAAIIDRKTLRRLIIARLQSDLPAGVKLYDASQSPPADQERWVQIVAIDTRQRPRGGKAIANHPDLATLTLTLTVAVSSAAIAADVGELDTVASQVAAAIAECVLEDAATGHRLELGPAAVTEDPQDQESPIRSAAISINGHAMRAHGQTTS